MGLDGDEKALEIAKSKIALSDLEIELRKGFSFQLNFPDQSFDRVMSSLLFHHLNSENKLGTLGEVYRILQDVG